jgi:hypothetical protein
MKATLGEKHFFKCIDKSNKLDVCGSKNHLHALGNSLFYIGFNYL